jgi:secondary thiamine-phosphate synthase enzyme
MVYQEDIRFSTSGNGDLHDLSEKVREIISQSKVDSGLVNIFALGSTAAIGVIEYEPGLKRDLPEMLNRLIPASRSYGHEQAWHDGNGHSHLQATLLGPELTLPVRDGELLTGTWQQIIHLECDIRSRNREVVVTVYGSS